jgi:polysaccharide pyruvyl transferase WcaK-like protein
MLIVPGTGIVTDHRCGPWFWPYELFKCCALAGLCRVEVLFLSVGAGPVHHPLSRWMITRSLTLARYRSYRDEDSRRCLTALGFDAGRDAVYPDLVFGLDTRILSQSVGDAGDARSRVVGLGLKDYSGPEEGTDDAGYRGYLEAMATFVSWLAERGYTVRLLIGDFQYDNRVRQDLLQLLAERNPRVERMPVLVEPVPTVGELLRQLTGTDFVISPRLHNLILALMLGKPVIALCDLPKVRALLADLQLSEYCLPIESLEVAAFTSSFLQLESDAVRLKSHIRERTDCYRHAVERQYEVAFAASGAR